MFVQNWLTLESSALLYSKTPSITGLFVIANVLRGAFWFAFAKHIWTKRHNTVKLLGLNAS